MRGLVPDTHGLIDLNQEHPTAARVRDWIAWHLSLPKLDSNQILFTTGADAAIHLVAVGLLRNKTVDTFDLNYQYADRILAQFAQLRAHSSQWELERGARRLPTIDPDATVFLTNPDNRLGLRAENLPGVRLLVVDESYADFDDLYDFTGMNPIIRIRSFSKLFGLQDLRIGYIFAEPKLLDTLRPLIPQYQFATASVDLLARTLEKATPERVRVLVAQIRSAKEDLLRQLSTHMVPFVHSHGDFITVPGKDAASLDYLTGPICAKEFTIDDQHFVRLRIDSADIRRQVFA